MSSRPGTSDNELEISIILPIYNEAGTIERVLPEIIDTMSSNSDRFEVIAVDDGSVDGTADRLRELGEVYPGQLRVVRHLHNRGNGAALRSGTRIAQGSIVVYMDGDGQHSAADIASLIDQIPPYDLVIGTRTEGYAGAWYRNAANRFFNRFASWLSQTEVKDLTSGFRAMRRSAVLHFLHLFPSGFSSPTTTTLAFLKAGYNVAFIPIHVGQRTAGESKINILADGIQFIIIILRMIMLYDPMRIFLPTGLVLTVLGFLAGAAGIWNAGRLVLSNSAIFLFLAGVIVWLLSLIAGQISSTLVHYHGDETILVDEQPTQRKPEQPGG